MSYGIASSASTPRNDPFDGFSTAPRSTLIFAVEVSLETIAVNFLAFQNLACFKTSLF